jgi:hypothetical protein
MDDIDAQLDRTKELLKDLEKEYLNSIHIQQVTSRAKVITHQVIESLSNVLDQLSYKLWKQKVSPKLTEAERKKADKNVYFPFGKDKQMFDSALGKWGEHNNIDTDLLDFLSRWQSFNIKDDWLLNLKSLARNKHIGLIPQKVSKVTHIEYSSSAGTVHLISENIKFGPGVSILGAPIDPTTQRIIPTEGVKEEIDQWNSFILEGYDLDALSFCNSSLERVEQIVKEAAERYNLS